ncbi:unnamed protein product [Sphagnum compactum]
MERYFNGNSSVQSPAPTKTDPNPLPSEASEPDTKSAAYQEIVGNPVSNDPKSPDYTPDISPAALPVANTDAVQWLNNSYVGGILSFSDFARSMGGSPLSTSAANAVTAAANGSVATLYDHESFVDRTFSPQ